MGSGTRCRSQKSLAKRAQRPQAQISSQWAQISKQRAVLEAKRNAVTTDVNKWLELKERIRCQVRDVRKRDKALEDRRREHQRERETVMTVAAQLPAKLDNQAYLTAQVAHRLENIADRLPSSGSSSKLLAMMLAIRSLCGQLKEAQAPEAGSKRTISDVACAFTESVRIHLLEEAIAARPVRDVDDDRHAGKQVEISHCAPEKAVQRDRI